MAVNRLLHGITSRYFYQGEPASGAQVYFYESGTTDDKTAYTDAALTTPIANPATANADGEITVYLGDGRYTIRVETSGGALIDTEDNVFVIDSTLLSDAEETLGITLADVNTEFGAEDLLRYLPEDQHASYLLDTEAGITAQNDNAVYVQRWIDVLSATGIRANPTRGAVNLESALYLKSSINAPDLSAVHFANRSTSGQDKQVFKAGTIGSEDALSAWQAATAYAIGDRVTNDTGKEYYCSTAGTSAGSGGPTGTGSAIADNTCVWEYVTTAASYGNSLWGATLSYAADDPTAGDATIQITGAGDYSKFSAGQVIAIRSKGADLFPVGELTPYTLPAEGEMNVVESVSSGLITLRRGVRRDYTDCYVHVVDGSDVRAAVLDANGIAPYAIRDTVWKGFRASQDPTITEWSVLSLGGMIDCDVSFTGWAGFYNGAALNAVEHCKLSAVGEYEKRLIEMAYQTGFNEYYAAGASNATPEAKAAVTLSSNEQHSRLELGTIMHGAASGAAIAISGVGTGVEVIGGTVYGPNVTRSGIDFGSSGATSQPTQCSVADTRFICGVLVNRGIEIYGESGVVTGHSFTGVVIEGSAAGTKLVYARSNVNGCHFEVEGAGTYDSADPIDNTGSTLTANNWLLSDGTTRIQPDALRTQSFDLLDGAGTSVLASLVEDTNDPAFKVTSATDVLRLKFNDVLKYRFGPDFLALDATALIHNTAAKTVDGTDIDALTADIITINDTVPTTVTTLQTYADQVFSILFTDANTTLQEGAAFEMTDGVDYVGAAGEVITFIGRSGTNAKELSRSRVPAGGGDVSLSPTPANNQIAVWTNGTTIEGDANLTWDGATFNVTGNITTSGTVDGIDIATDVAANTAKDTNATHTGDVTGSGALTIAADAVTYAKMQNVVADNVLLGNNSGAGAIVDELTAAEVRTLLGVNRTAYGEMYIDGNGTATTLAGAATWTQVTAGWTTGEVSNVTFSTNQLDIDSGYSGRYRIGGFISYSVASTGNNYEWGISSTGTPTISAKSTMWDRPLAGSGLIKTIPLPNLILNLTGGTHEVSLWVRNTPGTNDPTIWEANLNIVRLGA